MSKAAFGKFINPKPTGAKKKEQHKQEKRAIKKEREAFFDNQKREQRAAKKEAFAQKQFFEETKRGIKPNSKYEVRNTKDEGRFAKPESAETAKETAPLGKDGKPMRKRIYKEEDKFKSNAGKKSFFKTKETLEAEKKAIQENAKKIAAEKALAKTNKAPKRDTEDWQEPASFTGKRMVRREQLVPLNKPVVIAKAKVDAAMPLNKYVAHCGVSSRREAATIITQGKIMVNNKIELEPGYKVQENDVIKLDGKKITPQNNLVYILLNKPKDFLTTADDPQGRKTVMDLIGNATPERVYPVGRLDRNTTGVLLFTNDGDLAQKLTHPKHGVKKIYEVKLDKPLTKTDAEKILAGLNLEDGFIAPDALAFVDNNDKSIVGVEIHSGKNRIVRRMFEHLGYDVRNLDRVMFANLTKKNVERGRYRFLNEKEVRNLKFLNASKTK